MSVFSDRIIFNVKKQKPRIIDSKAFIKTTGFLMKK